MKFDQGFAIRNLAHAARLGRLGFLAAGKGIEVRTQRHGHRIDLVARLAHDRCDDCCEEVDILAGWPATPDSSLVMAGHTRRVVVHRSQAIARMASRLAGNPLPSEEVPPLCNPRLGDVTSPRRFPGQGRRRAGKSHAGPQPAGELPALHVALGPLRASSVTHLEPLSRFETRSRERHQCDLYIFVLRYPRCAVVSKPSR